MIGDIIARELRVMRNFASCRRDDDCITAAETELASMQERIRELERCLDGGVDCARERISLKSALRDMRATPDICLRVREIIDNALPAETLVTSSAQAVAPDVTKMTMDELQAFMDAAKARIASVAETKGEQESG